MKRKQHYTLIEIMVVMALAAILTAMALPAFRALSTGSSVGETTSIIKNAMAVAQSRAVSRREYVAVVFDHKAQREKADDMQAIRLASVKVTYDDNGNMTGYEFDRWLPDESWRILNEGAALLAVTEEKTTDEANASATASALNSVKGGKSAVDFDKLEAIKSIPKADGGNDKFTGYGVIFSRYGGLYKPAKSLRFTIGEALFNDQKYVIKDTDASGVPANYLQFTLNQFTGRTEVQERE